MIKKTELLTRDDIIISTFLWQTFLTYTTYTSVFFQLPLLVINFNILSICIVQVKLVATMKPRPLQPGHRGGGNNKNQQQPKQEK